MAIEQDLVGEVSVAIKQSGKMKVQCWHLSLDYMYNVKLYALQIGKYNEKKIMDHRHGHRFQQ